MAGGAGYFRRDLYYRLSTHLIKIPPLRDRREDIPLLAEKLASEAAKGMKKPIPYMSKHTLDILKNYSYPGNIRELKTYIFDAVARSGEIMEDRFLLERIGEESKAASFGSNNERIGLESVFGHFPTIEELIEYAVTYALDSTNNNQSQAAKLLGISKQAINKRIQKRTR